MTHRVGPKEHVVIPKDLRGELGIEPGDEVSSWRDGDHVALRRHSTHGRCAAVSPALRWSNELAAERGADRRREHRR
jgi:AbrB family looped-hinge helix DNA binding protein